MHTQVFLFGRDDNRMQTSHATFVPSLRSHIAEAIYELGPFNHS